MLDSLLRYLSDRTPAQLLRDVFDVFIVYYCFYRLLLVARGTRAMQVGLGIGVVALVYVVAQFLQLSTVLTILGSLIQSILLIVVVVFQSDIRRALQRVGSRAWFGGLARAQESRVIDEVVEAARELARHRIGAIIAFEQDANLDEFVGNNKGHDIDAKVTQELLVSLFTPESSNKLHDGAVIIRDLRIAKAGVFFPMPEGRIIDQSFGSRHRAALGITEETDAVVVIVSEERGTISFCFNGNIASDLQAGQLKEMLESIFSPKVRKKSRAAQRKRAEVAQEAATVEPEVARVSLKGPAPQSSEEEEAPPSARPSTARPVSTSPPPPLRKRTDTEVISPDPDVVTRREPRPMPKATDPDRASSADRPTTVDEEVPGVRESDA
jgi:diadenylate cyclase